MTALPAATPLPLRRLLARCLDRDPRMRLRDIGEARVEIDWTIAGVGDGAVASVTASATASAGARLAWMAVAVLAALAAALSIPAVRYLGETLPPEMRVKISTQSTLQPRSLPCRPTAGRSSLWRPAMGRNRLWLRPLDKAEALPLAGTEGPEYQFWSADSRALGFGSREAGARFGPLGSTLKHPSSLATPRSDVYASMWGHTRVGRQPKEDRAMPKYITFFSYTRESATAMMERPSDRTAAARTLVESVGGQMEAFYWMHGKHDGFIIGSYPDGASAAALATAAASTGAIAQTETHEIFDRDAQTQIMKAAKAAVGSYKPPTA